MRKRLTKFVYAPPLVVYALLMLPSVSGASEQATGESPWSLLFKFLNVAIFVAIIYRLGAKKIGEFFKNRRQQAREAIEGAVGKEGEAARQLKEWKERIAGTEEEAKKIVEASVTEGRNLKAKLLKEAEEEARAILEQARVAAAEEVKRIRAMLGKELAAISASKAEALLREKMTPEHHKRLVEEFLRKMEDLS
jgi:F-type H+-transporting ATPase subunit b